MELARTSPLEPTSNRVEPWPWNIIENGDTSLDLVACKILTARGGVEIKPHEPKYPDKYLWIFVSKNNWKLLDKVRKENEFVVLQQAMYGISELSVLSIPTRWNEVTKSQVKALFWEKRSMVLSNIKNNLALSSPNEGLSYW